MKRIALALSVAAGIAAGIASGGTPFSAASDFSSARGQNSQGGQWIVIGGDEDGKDRLEELLEKCGIRFEIIVSDKCPWVPGIKPEIPESPVPEETQPESTAPETSVPETAEETRPEPTAPETSAPQQPSPEETRPEPTAPETQPPVTQPEQPSSPSETEKPSETVQPSETVHPYVERIVELVNEERAKAGLKPLTLDTAASRAAQIRAAEIVNSFSHTRPDGRSFTTALIEQGVSYRLAGENIAWGQRTPEQVMEGWMNSPGHRANILRESFTKIGVGYHRQNGTNYWTQLFFQ